VLAPLLQALTATLVGRRELWASVSPPRENLEKTRVLPDGIASILGPEAARAAGLVPRQPPFPDDEATIKKTLLLPPEKVAALLPAFARPRMPAAAGKAPTVTKGTRSRPSLAALAEPYLIGAAVSTVLIMAIVAIIRLLSP
jgi:hypothetical protein